MNLLVDKQTRQLLRIKYIYSLVVVLWIMKVFRTHQDHQHICRIEKKDKMFVEPLSDLSQYKARQIAGYKF